MSRILRIGLVIFTAAAGTSAVAQQEKFAIGARQAQMELQGFHAGYIWAMSQGKAPYDAAAAQKAADSLVALLSVDQSRYWIPGTDDMSADDTRALPAIWDNPEDVGKKLAAVSEATLQLQAVASDGQEALGPAIGALFGACTECHKVYRAPEN